MKKLLLLCSYFFIYSSYAGEGPVAPDNPSADAQINKIFAAYQQALIAHDSAFSSQWFISQEEYQQLLDYVKKTQPNCIGTDESEFRADGNKITYNELLSSQLAVEKITVKSIEHSYSCGNLFEIPRVICDVQVNNRIIEVPFLLVWTLNNQYKILRNFLSYKMLAHG